MTESTDVHLKTIPSESRPLPPYSVAFEAGTVGRVFIDGRLIYDGPGRLFILTKEVKQSAKPEGTS